MSWYTKELGIFQEPREADVVFRYGLCIGLVSCYWMERESSGSFPIASSWEAKYLALPLVKIWKSARGRGIGGILELEMPFLACKVWYSCETTNLRHQRDSWLYSSETRWRDLSLHEWVRSAGWDWRIFYNSQNLMVLIPEMVRLHMIWPREHEW